MSSLEEYQQQHFWNDPDLSLPSESFSNHGPVKETTRNTGLVIKQGNFTPETIGFIYFADEYLNKVTPK